MQRYDPAAVEAKWQQVWHDADAFTTPNPQPGDEDARMHYVLEMLLGHSESGLAYDDCIGVTYEDVHADGEAALEEVREVASRAFTALGLEGLARVDVFVTEAGEVVVNEVNTMPGFTPYSMFPVLWRNMGVEYTALITDLLEQALARPLGSR